MNRRLAQMGMIASLFMIQGCLGDRKFSMSSFSSPQAATPAAAVAIVQTMWENRVVVTEDTVNNGAPLPGLAGRVYFFGSNLGHPLHGKGTLTVTAHEVLPDSKTVPMEAWEIDPKTLQRLGSTDRLGWGYTVFLPITHYRTDLKRVRLQAKFVPEGGTPLFSSPDTVSLTEGTPPVITSNVIPLAGVQTEVTQTGGIQKR